jgi:hypothetical protein
VLQIGEIIVLQSVVFGLSASGAVIGTGDASTPTSELEALGDMGAQIITRIGVEDTEFVAGSVSECVIWVGRSASRINVEDIELRSVLLRLIDGEAGIGTGAVSDRGIVKVEKVDILDSEIEGRGTGIVIGIGSVGDDAKAGTLISVGNCHIVMNMEGNGTGIGIGALTHANSVAHIAGIILANTSMNVTIEAGTGIGIGGVYEAARAEVGQIQLTNSTTFDMRAKNGAGIGTGVSRKGNAVISGIIINQVTGLIATSTGAAIGAGEMIGDESTVVISNISFEGSTLVLSANSSAAVGGLQARIDFIQVANSTLTVSGVIGFGAQMDPHNTSVTFVGPAEITCMSAVFQPCFTSEDLELDGESLHFSVNGQSAGPQYSDGMAGKVIRYRLPSIPERYSGGQPSLHFARLTASGLDNFTFAVSDDVNLTTVTFEMSTADYKSFSFCLIRLDFLSDIY